jgi:putative membrane protein
MRGFLLRLLITILGLYLASELLSGVMIDGTGTFIIAALLLGVVNAIVRPILFLLTLPLTIVTLGLFILVLNGLMFAFVAAILPGFGVAGLGSSILGAIIVGLTSIVASWFIGPDGRYEVIVVERRR